MCKLAGRFAQGQVDDNIVAGVRLGRMTALVKPAGGVRGNVVGTSLGYWLPSLSVNEWVPQWRR